MLLKKITWIFAFALVLTASSQAQSVKKELSKGAKTAPLNTLTKKEKAAGWKLLFDGKSTQGWRGFHSQEMPSQVWVVEDGVLKKIKAEQKYGSGDVITNEQFENFELSIEWKLTPGANGGIKYLVVESLPPTGKSGISFEYQILDDVNHPDAKAGIAGNRTAGSLYDLIPAAKNKPIKPIGEWNHTRIIKQGNHVEHWLNGMKVLEFELGSPELQELIAKSKFKVNPEFGKARKGHILLQDHGDEVWYRNIKIRELPVAKSSR
ncbi:MAG TPA: DUF1080 domain-containing protein [Blastocatellia bacterium]|nr:DUF1080 domain-containing protein [Blastocatellia bacterium]